VRVGPFGLSRTCSRFFCRIGARLIEENAMDLAETVVLVSLDTFLILLVPVLAFH